MHNFRILPYKSIEEKNTDPSCAVEDLGNLRDRVSTFFSVARHAPPPSDALCCDPRLVNDGEDEDEEHEEPNPKALEEVEVRLLLGVLRQPHALGDGLVARSASSSSSSDEDADGPLVFAGHAVKDFAVDQGPRSMPGIIFPTQCNIERLERRKVEQRKRLHTATTHLWNMGQKAPSKRTRDACEEGDTEANVLD